MQFISTMWDTRQGSLGMVGAMSPIPADDDGADPPVSPEMLPPAQVERIQSALAQLARDVRQRRSALAALTFAAQAAENGAVTSGSGLPTESAKAAAEAAETALRGTVEKVSIGKIGKTGGKTFTILACDRPGELPTNQLLEVLEALEQRHQLLIRIAQGEIPDPAELQHHLAVDPDLPLATPWRGAAPRSFVRERGAGEKLPGAHGRPTRRGGPRK